MESIENYENRELCAKCGGLCCKMSGCDFFVTDFDNLKIEYLESVLNTGRVSVTGNLAIKHTKNGNPYTELILALKARNVGRDEIDLWSISSRCVNLEENGCYFDVNERPSGGVHLIAKPNRKCKPDYDMDSELEKWLPYQNVLRKLVKRRTGMTVEAKLRQDIENTFYDLLMMNYENSHPVVIENAIRMAPDLAMLYPMEISNAKKRVKINKKDKK